MNRRHLFLLALAIVCLITLVHMQGCATEYQWTKVQPAATDYLWRKVPRDEMYRVCGYAPETFRNLGGCAFLEKTICTVYSYLSEYDAKRTISGDGIDLFTHEVWDAAKTVGHCAGYAHGTHGGIR